MSLLKPSGWQLRTESQRSLEDVPGEGKWWKCRVAPGDVWAPQVDSAGKPERCSARFGSAARIEAGDKYGKTPDSTRDVNREEWYAFGLMLPRDYSSSDRLFIAGFGTHHDVSGGVNMHLPGPMYVKADNGKLVVISNAGPIIYDSGQKAGQLAQRKDHLGSVRAYCSGSEGFTAALGPVVPGTWHRMAVGVRWGKNGFVEGWLDGARVFRKDGVPTLLWDGEGFIEGYWMAHAVYRKGGSTETWTTWIPEGMVRASSLQEVKDFHGWSGSTPTPEPEPEPEPEPTPEPEPDPEPVPSGGVKPAGRIMKITGANVLPDPVAEGGFYRYLTRKGLFREADGGTRQHSEFLFWDGVTQGVGKLHGHDRISWSAVYPTEFRELSGEGYNIVFQVHADAGIGGGVSPTLTVRVVGGKLYVQTRGGAGHPSPVTATLLLAPLVRNVQYDWSVEAKWEQNATGFVIVYLNGKEVARKEGIATLHAESDHTGAVRLGHYHSGDFDSEVLDSFPYLERNPGLYVYRGKWAHDPVAPYKSGGSAPAKSYPLYGGAVTPEEPPVEPEPEPEQPGPGPEPREDELVEKADDASDVIAEALAALRRTGVSNTRRVREGRAALEAYDPYAGDIPDTTVGRRLKRREGRIAAALSALKRRRWSLKRRVREAIDALT